MEWEPKWYFISQYNPCTPFIVCTYFRIPKLEFINAMEEHLREWEPYHEEGTYSMRTFKDFAQEKGDKIEEGKFDCTKARFIRAKLECDMTMTEEFWLESFPFDCQDLSCIIRETTRDINLCILPELRKPHFASIDPRFFVLNAWNLEFTTLELGTTNGGSSRSSTTYPTMALNVKLSRRWTPVLIDTGLIIFLVALLSFTVFTVDHNEVSDRLGLSLTLLLTAVLFETNNDSTSYLRFLDKYVLTCYSYLTLLMIENAIAGYYDEEFDNIMFWIMVGIFIIYHIMFIFYGISVRKFERFKLRMSAIEIEEEMALYAPVSKFDYRKSRRVGLGGSNFVFEASCER